MRDSITIFLAYLIGSYTPLVRETWGFGGVVVYIVCCGALLGLLIVYLDDRILRRFYDEK